MSTKSPPRNRPAARAPSVPGGRVAPRLRGEAWGGAPARPPRERLNLRLLGILAAVAAVVGAAWYGLHAWQVQRNEAALLVQADAAEAQQRPDRAARFLGLYVGLAPQDTDARERYGRLLDRLADTPKARAGVEAVFEEVLLRDPDRQGVRRRLARLYLDAGQFDDALQHLDYLQKALPEDAEVLAMVGRCREERGQYVQAAADYRSSLKQAPGDVESSLRLARLLRDRLSRPVEADQLLADLIKADPQSYQARLARARFLQEGTQTSAALEAARKDMDEALRLAPDSADVLLGAADLAQKRPDGRDEARADLKQMLEHNPDDARGYSALADLELHAGRTTEAMDWLRRGLDRLPDQPDLLWNLANLTVQLGSPDEGERLATRLAGLDAPAPRLDYLRAALRFRRGDCAGACHDLEGVRPLLIDSRELTVQCDLLLARCHAAFGDLDGEALICRRAIALGPLQTGARFMLASTLFKLGRTVEAVEECQHLTSLPQPPAEAWLLLTRLLILQNLRLPPEHQQWDDVERALAHAGDAPEVPLLRAEVLFARKKIDDARTLLEQARDKAPGRADLWFALADLAVREGKSADARSLLDEAERRLGDSAGLRLARLRCLIASDATGDGKALAALEEGLDRLPEEDRAQVLDGLAEAYAARGRSADARRLWTESARLRPGDLDVRLRLFDLALQDRDDGFMKQALADIRQLEGDGGPLGCYDEARRLIAEAAAGEKSGLVQARSDLLEVDSRRPGWSRVALALGQVEDLEGHEDQALENYQRAIELGDHQLELVKRTVQLLYKRRRYTDADLVLRELPAQTPLLGDLQRLAAEVSLQSGDYNRALDLAGTAVAADATDYHDHIWLSQMLWAAAQRADISPEQRKAAERRAEQALRRAVALGGAAPDAWVALVQHLARVGEPERAEDALHEAEGKLSAADAPLALAQRYTALNRLDKAKELFQAALRAKPDDLAALRVAADFYLRTNDLGEAEACLRKVIELGIQDPEAGAWARSVLAVVLAAGGDYQRSHEALALVGLVDETGDKLPAASEGTEQERSRAVVLALQPGRRSHQEAIEILERMSVRQALSAEDQFLLAQLYEQVGKPQRAWDRLLPLLQAGGNPRYLAHAVGVLLDQGRTDEADAWFADLQKLQPDALRTTFLQARLLKARGKAAEAVAVLRKQAAGKPAPAVLRVAELIEELGEGGEAEDLYRRYAKEAKEPDAALALARYLGRRKRLAEALDVCDAAWDACPPDAVAEASLAVLYAAPADDAQATRVERRLAAALAKEPDRPGLVLCQASLEELRGRYEAAETLYRKVLLKDGRNAVAANNLAWILALRDGRADEALALVGRAVDVLGPIPELLDTRAVAQLSAGRTDAALSDLGAALDRTGLDPKVRSSLYYHLAQAQSRAGDRAAAEKTWREAVAQGLTADALHPLERAAFAKWAGDLARP